MCYNGVHGSCKAFAWERGKDCYLFDEKIYLEDNPDLIYSTSWNIYQWECEGHAAETCMMENHVIDNLPNSSFTASTVKTSDHSQPHQAKFENFQRENFLGAFRPLHEDNNQWLQVDLIDLYNITGYHILGGGRVNKYTINDHYFLYSINCLEFEWYKNKNTGASIVSLNVLIRLF